MLWLNVAEANLKLKNMRDVHAAECTSIFEYHRLHGLNISSSSSLPVAAAAVRNDFSLRRWT